MTNQTKHTATPWKAEKRNVECQRTILSAAGGYLAIIGNPWTPYDDETEANAAFIVTACNSHDELLEACKEALKQLSERGHLYHEEQLAITKLEKAIAKAEGK
jgi:hypothetical protein